MYGISKTKYEKLLAWMIRLDVTERDFREDFIQSPGKGGQNVNKVATAVCLVHVPTGLSVKCHQQRLQGANRYLARCLLLEKIECLQNEQRRMALAKKEKLRRQKRGRSTKGKEKMLADKKYRSQKKVDRSLKIEY